MTNTAVMASVHRLPEGGASQEQRSSPPRVLHPFLLWWDPLPVVLLPFLPLFFFFLNISVHTVPSPFPNSHLITELHGLKILLAAVIKPTLKQDADLMRLPWKHGSFCQAEECVCARGRGQAGRRVARRWRCWLDGSSRELQEASWPSSLFWKGFSLQLGTPPTRDGQLSWSAAPKEPHCVSPAKETSLCQEGDKYLPRESLKQSNAWQLKREIN